MQARGLPNVLSISNTEKMVPEGGFEPPTRGFSIQLKAQFSAPFSVKGAQNGVNKINSLQKPCKVKKPKPSRNSTAQRWLFRLP